MRNMLLYLILFNLVVLGFCKLEETFYDLVLDAQGISQPIVGAKGVFGLITNLSNSDTILDDGIENQQFRSKIIGENIKGTYEVKCHLWKSKSSNLMVLCELQEEINKTSISFKLDESIINYKDISIKIYTRDFIEIKISQIPLPFIYSEKHSINFNDGKNSYILKFKVEQFYDNALIVSKNNNKIYKALECIVEGKELICKLEKEKMEGYLFSVYENFDIQCLNGNLGPYYCGIPGDLLIEYAPDKENINIEIKNLLTKAINSKNYIAYETNIISLSELSTDSFTLRFKKNNIEEQKKCILRKHNKKDPLMILCETNQDENGSLVLFEITEDLILNYVSTKFTFIIKPIKIDEAINVNKNGNLFYSIYPEILDYSKKDNQKIVLIGDFTYWNHQSELYLFTNTTKLDCELNNEIVECSIPKSYFEGKENGYYYINQINHLGEINPIYEIPSLKVILSGGSDTTDNSFIQVRLINLIIISLIFFLL